jgi:hypothetical protein
MLNVAVLKPIIDKFIKEPKKEEKKEEVKKEEKKEIKRMAFPIIYSKPNSGWGMR